MATLEEVTKAIKMEPTGIRRLLRAGKIKGEKKDGHWTIDLGSAKKYVADGAKAKAAPKDKGAKAAKGSTSKKAKTKEVKAHGESNEAWTEDDS